MEKVVFINKLGNMACYNPLKKGFTAYVLEGTEYDPENKKVPISMLI